MKRMLLYIYLPLIALYLCLSVAFPIDPETLTRRNLDPTQARLLSLSVSIPLIIVWLVALYGSQRLKDYSRSIKNSLDGPPLIKLATGLQIIALYLPLRAVARAVFNYLAHLYPSLSTMTNVVVTYLSLLVPLIAFILISQATRELTRVAKVRTSLMAFYGLGIAFIALSVWYCYISFTTQDNIFPLNWLVTTQQDIPLLLRTITVTIPYLFMWLIGLVAVCEIYLYQRRVKGIFYRRSLRLLSIGLATVVLVSILIQVLTLVAADIQHLSLRWVLAIAYSLILVLGGGFVIIAKGVQRFRKLDDIQ